MGDESDYGELALIVSALAKVGSIVPFDSHRNICACCRAVAEHTTTLAHKGDCPTEMAQERLRRHEGV